MSTVDTIHFSVLDIFMGIWELSRGSHTVAQNEQDNKQKIGRFRMLKMCITIDILKKLI